MANERILILMDTCSYEAFSKGRSTKAVESFKKELLKENHIGVITDLSFVELVEGRNTLSEFNSFRNQFSNQRFGVFGHSHILSLIGTDALTLSFKTEQEYQLFKGEASKMKADIVKPLFKEIILKHMILFITVLAHLDKEYFSPFTNIVVEAMKERYDELDIIFNDVFDIISNLDEKDQKWSLYDYCSNFMEIIAQVHKPGYIENEISNKLNELNVKVKLKDYTKQFLVECHKKEEYKSLYNKNNIIFLMNILASNKLFRLSEDEIDFDGTSYSAIMSGFCQGSFQYNDLVDIYNVAFLANNKEKFLYFTEEDRWNDFVELERKRKKF